MSEVLLKDNILYKKLSKVADFIKEKFGAEKIILFGSYAYGNPAKDSDIDLLVIMETEERFPVEGANIKIAVRKNFGFFKPMDIIVRTPRYIKERLKENDFFLKEIISKGVEL